MSPAAPVTARCVTMVGTDAIAFATRHGRLIAAAAGLFDKIVCIVPDGSLPAIQALMRTGTIVDPLSFDRRGFGPLASYRIRRALASALATHAPDVIVVTDVACLVPLAATLDPRRETRLVFWPARAEAVAEVDAWQRDRAVCQAFAGVSALVAATPASARRFSALAPRAVVHIVPSAAMDMTQSQAMTLPPIDGGLVVRCITSRADMAAHAVFQAAAREVVSRSPSLRFVVGGDVEQIAASHVVVHAGTGPGLPMELVAALALGRPLMTTDVEGARETVDERINGWRVAPGDAQGLAEACIAAGQRPDLLPVLGRASRAKAERHFDARMHLATGLALLGAGARTTDAAA